MEDNFQDPPFDPDWHNSQSEDAQFVLYLIGLFSVEWNMIEHYMSAIIWNYVGGQDVGMIITANMGNRSKADALLELAEKQEKDKKLLEFIKFAVKCFNRIRENRNVIMHSHSIVPRKEGKLEFRRTHPKSYTYHVGVLTSVGEIQKNIEACLNLAYRLTPLKIFTLPHDQRIEVEGMPFPDKFPLPRKLIQIPEDPPIAPLPLEPSQA